jgi:hypothetical protein
MSRQPFEDVVPPHARRSIREIPIGRGTFGRHDLQNHKHEDRYDEEDEDSASHDDVRPRSKKGVYVLWLAAVVCAVIIFFVVASFFVSARIIVTPKSALASVNTTLSAVKNSGDGAVPQGKLAFETVSIGPLTQTEPVTASGTTTANTKASGQIIVYNNASASPLHYVASTRFQTSSGLIFRVQSAFTIPGKTTKAPGSIAVTIYADQPGAQYNIGLTDFTLPGLSSNPNLFKNVYARSKTAMSGGASGITPVIRQSDLTAAKQIADASLTTSLTTALKAQIPDGYVAFPSSTFISFQSMPSQSIGDSTTTAQTIEQGTLNAIVFSSQDLSEALARASLSSDAYNGTDTLGSADLNTLSLSINGSTTTSPWLQNTLSLSFSGPVTFIWQYDQNALKTAVLGHKASEIPTILTQFPMIADAQAELSPFWRSSFPTNPAEIIVTTKPQ